MFVIAETYTNLCFILSFSVKFAVFIHMLCGIMTLMLLLDCAASTLQLALTHDALMWPLHVAILILDTLLLKVLEMYKAFVADCRLILSCAMLLIIPI